MLHPSPLSLDWTAAAASSSSSTGHFSHRVRQRGRHQKMGKNKQKNRSISRWKADVREFFGTPRWWKSEARPGQSRDDGTHEKWPRHTLRERDVRTCFSKNNKKTMASLYVDGHWQSFLQTKLGVISLFSFLFFSSQSRSKLPPGFFFFCSSGSSLFLFHSQKKNNWKYSQKKKKKKRWWLLDDIYRVACGHRGGWLVETKERRDIYVISTGGSDQVYCRTWDGIERRRCASAHIFLKNVHSPPPQAAATGTHHTYLPGTCT